jgi:hypothetical protein
MGRDLLYACVEHPTAEGNKRLVVLFLIFNPCLCLCVCISLFVYACVCVCMCVCVCGHVYKDGMELCVEHPNAEGNKRLVVLLPLQHPHTKTYLNAYAQKHRLVVLLPIELFAIFILARVCTHTQIYIHEYAHTHSLGEARTRIRTIKHTDWGTCAQKYRRISADRKSINNQHYR